MGGGLPWEGVVAEKFAPSLETLSSLGFDKREAGRAKGDEPKGTNRAQTQIFADSR